VTDREALERVTRAYAAFLAVLEAGMQPTLTASIQTGLNWREGEYDVLVEGLSHHGVLHEDIETALAIATKHGGRLFLLGSGDEKGTLAILFPYERVPGPDGSDDSAGPGRKAPAKRRKKVAA
jgi:hypothetical protein